jgi:hypothetical protein
MIRISLSCDGILIASLKSGCFYSLYRLRKVNYGIKHGKTGNSGKVRRLTGQVLKVRKDIEVPS